MADEQHDQQRPWERIDRRTQNVLSVIATHIATFYEQGRTGTVSFDIQFDEGRIPEKGFHQRVDEEVL